MQTYKTKRYRQAYRLGLFYYYILSNISTTYTATAVF
jgi:hypothetical protein